MLVSLRRWSLPLLVLMLLGIGILTLSPQPDPGYGGTGFRCLLCGSRGIADLVLNVALFVPLGWALGARGARPIAGLGISLAIAGGVEVLQLLIPGREATVRDILTNGLGGGIGCLIFAYGRGWLADRRQARVASCLALVALVGVVGIVGPVLAPRPAPDRIFVGWNPNQDHLERWTGAIHRVEIGGRPAAPGGTADGTLINSALLHGATIDIQASAGVPTSRVAGIFTVNDRETNEILLVGAERRDLVVRFRRAASVLRLDSPVLRFREALAPIPAGQPLHITVHVTDAGACAAVNEQTTCTAPFSVGSAWSLLAWRDDAPRSLIRFLDATTLGILFGTLTIFFPAVGRFAASALLGGAGVAIALASTRWGLTIVAAPELLGIFGGAGLGYALSRLVRGSSWA